jgi:protein gp37
MADATTIEWTDATWNPVTGCTKISAGCDSCYAALTAHATSGVETAVHDFHQFNERPVS